MRTHTIEIEFEDPDDLRDVPWVARVASVLAEELDENHLTENLTISSVRALVYVPAADGAPLESGLIEVAEVPFDSPVS